MATRVRSFSKVNLGLRIGPVRPDGFHGLATVYQTLALHDVVTVAARRSGATRITIRTEHARVPRDGRNTAWAMAERALEAMGLTAEVEIGIEKRLPVQGGMGAGSANAAATLLGMERELGVRLGGAERLRVAAAVGSDVPLFLVGGAVLGMGRGEMVVALPDLRLGGEGGVPCVVAVPRVGVPTPTAFREWDRLVESGSVAGLTPATEASRLDELSLACSSAFAYAGWEGLEPGASGIDAAVSSPGGALERQQEAGRVDRAESSLLSLVHAGIENDFEEVVFPFYPSLREIKRVLLGEATGQPAVYAAMSGSGSALFGLYRSREQAEAAQQRVRSTGAEAFLTETLSRPEYWARMYGEAD